MARPLALILLVLLSACASRLPPTPVAAAPPPIAETAETVEPPDPAIRPLSDEIEEAGR